MSLDGAFLHIVKDELIQRKIIGGRVDKIYQPSRDEIVISMRLISGGIRLLASANSVSARVCITDKTFENPQSPPMFCMLLRKHLGGGKLIDISQDGFERIINLDFECMNEIGDMVKIRLTVEIMGRCSNIIMLKESPEGWRVIDSIKRVTDDISSVRRILPNIVYALPPREERLNLLTADKAQIIGEIRKHNPDKLSKALIKIFEGISPVFARECAYYVSKDVDMLCEEVMGDREERLMFFMGRAADAIKSGDKCVVIREKNGKPKDFCFIPIEQYGSEMMIIPQSSPNELLDGFYSTRDNADRVKQRSGDLLKKLMNTYERIEKKINLQRQELAACGEREKFRVCGDLLNANIYRIQKGMNEIAVTDYETGDEVTIKLDVRLSPAQNAQKYYSEYRKLATAEKMLTKLIKESENELIYVDSVFDEVSRTNGESELLEITGELIETGYIKSTKARKQNKMLKPQPPLKFRSSDGFEIHVGRNNIQNDKLTLKTAKGDDLWFHTQNIAGSHAIVFSEGKDIPDNTIVEAATLAAYCSKARESTKVPVDYTKVRYVKKPNGAKPGMVIFTNNKTILVNPDEMLYNKLKIK